MPQPSGAIMVWIATLSPADELAVRMAMSLSNPWCAADSAWQHRIAELQAKLVKSTDDRRHYERRAAAMARDMEAAAREIKEQNAEPPPVPSNPQ
jgi:hypothetical protein